MENGLDYIKALVIDDSKTMVRIITNSLKRLGISNIEVGYDGVEGIESFKSKHGTDAAFNVICTDINMPRKNGYDVIKAVRAVDQDVKIIVITTEGAKKDVIRALKLGCNNYITKPFTPEVLRTKIKEIFGMEK